jgi:uncharacterized protein
MAFPFPKATMPSFLVLALVLFFTAGCSKTSSATPMVTRDFEFVSGNKKLSGFIDQPATVEAGALIVFLHGSGVTDIRRENRYSDLRTRFAALGIACATWDKPGRGRSEGEFDDNQPFTESAREVVDAIAWLRARKIPGSQRIVLWGTSRGSLVAPLALAQDPTIKFWISVSGIPPEDNKHYLMAANLPLEGRTPEQTRRLLSEWRRGRQIFFQGGAYETYLSATENLRQDAAVRYFAGDLTGTRREYETQQANYRGQKDKYELEPETLALIRVPNFAPLLSALNIHVLALFGEKDTNDDWRKARALYESTLGANPKASLTVRTFPDGNHALTVSATGSVREVDGVPLEVGVKCDGYYESQIAWLRKHVISE